VEILIVAPNWLGDAIMALPAIRDVRRHFANDTLTIAARGSVAPIFRAVHGIDRIAVLDRGPEFAQLKGDIGILLPNSFRSAWLLRRAGVKERWGYRSDFRRMLLTKGIARPRRKVSFPEYYSNLVRAFDVPTGPLTARLDPSPSTVAAARRLLEDRGWTGDRPLVGIAPGAAFGHAKRWLPARFAELSRTIAGDSGAQCVILGRTEDRDAVADISGIDLVGQTDLTMLMGIVAHCRALIANDSGALHLAAALGVPTVGLYGPTDERYSKPIGRDESQAERIVALSEDVFCRPCFLADCPIDHRCMRRISVERVHAAVRPFLQERPS
jgi:heptosyltransferase-2